MFQSQLLYNQADVARLLGVQEMGLAFVNSAEVTAAGADVSQDQKGGGVMTPALADVRAARLFANGMKVMVS